MRLASYNIHGCVGTDGRRDPERVARVLRSLDADVVGLQEVDSRPGKDTPSQQMDYLAEATGYIAVPGFTIVQQDRRYGNALLVRRPVAQVRRHDISVPGREPRGVIDATLGANDGGLRVLVTHLGLRAGERRRQVRHLLEILDDHRGPLVLLGDFNEWLPRGGVLGPLHRRLGRCPGAPTFPSRFPFLALDRIWVVPGEALRRVSVSRGGECRRASDHLPVVAQVAFDG